MDYVLFGMGYGATLMLLGWALRTFGPERKYKDVNPEDIDRTVEQHRWVRFIQGLGGVIAIAGTAMVLFTFIIMLVNPDDETGSFMALVIWGFVGISVLIWCWFYVSTFGLRGIWSRHHGYGLRGTTSPAPVPVDAEGMSTARVVSASRIDEQDAEPEITGESAETDQPPSDEASDDLTGEQPTDGLIGPTMDELVADEASTGESEEVAAESEDLAAEPDSEYDFGDSSDTTVPSEIGGRSEAIRRLRERQTRAGDSSDET